MSDKSKFQSIVNEIWAPRGRLAGKNLNYPKPKTPDRQPDNSSSMGSTTEVDIERLKADIDNVCMAYVNLLNEIASFNGSEKSNKNVSRRIVETLFSIESKKSIESGESLIPADLSYNGNQISIKFNIDGSYNPRVLYLGENGALMNSTYNTLINLQMKMSGVRNKYEYWYSDFKARCNNVNMNRSYMMGERTNRDVRNALVQYGNVLEEYMDKVVLNYAYRFITNFKNINIPEIYEKYKNDSEERRPEVSEKEITAELKSLFDYIDGGEYAHGPLLHDKIVDILKNIKDGKYIMYHNLVKSEEFQSMIRTAKSEDTEDVDEYILDPIKKIFRMILMRGKEAFDKINIDDFGEGKTHSEKEPSMYSPLEQVENIEKQYSLLKNSSGGTVYGPVRDAFIKEIRKIIRKNPYDEDINKMKEVLKRMENGSDPPGSPAPGSPAPGSTGGGGGTGVGGVPIS